MKVGIVGNGYVGQATALLAATSNGGRGALIWDIDETKRNINDFGELSSCDLVFICVPTPMNKDGSCHTQVAEGCVYKLNIAGVRDEIIVMRSTVPVGFCKSIGVNFMPEFLTESNWKDDVKNCKTWILGTDTRDEEMMAKFFNFLEFSFDTGFLNNSPELLVSTTQEAELTKYVRNSFLATKVSFFNEIEDFCREKDLDYENVRRLSCLDDRIGESHTQVPGPDGKKGFGGTCFPKDVASLVHQINDEAPILSAVKYRNENLDRPEKDWKLSKGRAVVDPSSFPHVLS